MDGGVGVIGGHRRWVARLCDPVRDRVVGYRQIARRRLPCADDPVLRRVALYLVLFNT